VENFLHDIRHEFRRYKALADAAIVPLEAVEFFRRPAPQVNSVAIIVKHLAGNLRSRWTDFLTTDGEKPDRDRDGEFVIGEQDSQENLLAAWNAGWGALFTTIDALTEDDLDRTVTIRGEPHTAWQALMRAMSHVAYHVGQVLYLARWMQPESKWLTIPPGQSRGFGGNYRRPPS
jgi:uncharacterized damage-inducible protein DinB